MEGLFTERLQVRTRHLEQQVGALTKQLAAHKQDNARLLKSHSDATRKVQSLEEELKSERERCHKLSATLSSYRRNEKKKVLRSEEGDRHDYDSDPASSGAPGNATVSNQCRQDSRNLKQDENYQLLPNYMGIMPARFNHKLMKSKKTSKPGLQISCHDGQVGLRRPAQSIDPRDYCCRFCSCEQALGCDVISCADCCHNVEIFLTRRLHLNDRVREKCSTGSGLASKCLASKQCRHTQLHQSSHCLSRNDFACEHKYCPYVPKQQNADRKGSMTTSATSKNQVETKIAEQDPQSLTTLSAEGFYVKMQTAKVAPPQQQHEPPDTSRGFDRCASNGDECIAGRHFNLWSMQCVEALKAENEALRGALLSSKKVEIQELESELENIKQGAGKKIELASDKSATQHDDDHGRASNDSSDLNTVYNKSQVDPIKFLDSLHLVEDKILQKKVAILGLEGGGAHADDASVNFALSGDGVYVKASSIEDLRHLLKVVSSEVIVLRQENHRLKQTCHDATCVG